MPVIWRVCHKFLRTLEVDREVIPKQGLLVDGLKPKVLCIPFMQNLRLERMNHHGPELYLLTLAAGEKRNEQYGTDQCAHHRFTKSEKSLRPIMSGAV